MDALRAKFGVGGLTAELELALLAVVCALGAGSRTLVARRTGDTCTVERRQEGCQGNGRVRPDGIRSRQCDDEEGHGEIDEQRRSLTRTSRKTGIQ